MRILWKGTNKWIWQFIDIRCNKRICDIVPYCIPEKNWLKFNWTEVIWKKMTIEETTEFSESVQARWQRLTSAHTYTASEGCPSLTNSEENEIWDALADLEYQAAVLKSECTNKPIELSFDKEKKICLNRELPSCSHFHFHRCRFCHHNVAWCLPHILFRRRQHHHPCS